MKKIMLAVAALWAVAMLNAVPAYPGLITVNQADGSQISFYLHGDENFNFMTSTDGYLLATGENGLLEYGDFSNGKYVVPTGVAAHNELNRSLTEQMYVRGLDKVEAMAPRLNAVARQQRMKAEGMRPVQKFPKQGSPRTIIILVGFRDKPFTRSRKEFEDLANKINYSDNGGTGSIKDYFIEASFGKFQPQFDVYGPYTLPNNAEYYGKRNGTKKDQHAQEMIIDACNAAYNAGVDFSQYDTDGNGSIDNVFVYYAGHNEAEGGGDNTIWPHRSYILGSYVYNGKSLVDYACTSEYSGNYGSYMCGIGTFCHEFSHVVGLPDFYDTDYSAGYPAMGSWDIMTSGNYNNGGKTPPTYSAYERFYVGWLTPTPLTEDVSVDCEGTYELQSLISSNSAYIISETSHNLNGGAPNPNEFFMLEYRKKEGRDTYTSIGEGMLITHVVYDAGRWTSNKPNNDRNNLGYEPILPTQYSVQGNNYDCFPGYSGVNYCLLTPRGASEPFKREIVNIEDKGSYCEFDYIRNITNLQVKVKDIDAYTNQTNAIEEFEVNGFDINESVALSFKTSVGFKMRRKSEGGQFKLELTLTPKADNTINEIIEVQYTPQSVTYDEYQYNKFIASGSSGKLNKIVDFRYRNRRPIYIETPVANDAQNVHKSSFTANWNYINDTTADAKKAAKYYLDVYTISDEKCTETESFELFPDLSDGWQTNFNAVNTTYKMDGAQSVMFTSAADTLWTKEYIADVDSISFWISSITSEGLFKIEAQEYETGIWKLLKAITVDSKTSGMQTSKLPEGFKCRKFRMSYAPTKGQLVLDCFGATMTSTTSFVCKNMLVTDTFYNAHGLNANTEYRYVVRATDKDEKGRYENITDNSNEVLVVTKEGSQSEEDDTELELKVAFVEGVNIYMASVSEVIDGYALFIYDFEGKLVKKLPVTSSVIAIPELFEGIYILSYSMEGGKSKKRGVAKMYYHSKN